MDILKLDKRKEMWKCNEGINIGLMVNDKRKLSIVVEISVIYVCRNEVRFKPCNGN
jgi:hypothetical protein